MHKFKSQHLFFARDLPKIFKQEDAPDWLTSANTVKGSTMDMRWFWNDVVMKLKVDESVNTDFQKITRIE